MPLSRTAGTVAVVAVVASILATGSSASAAPSDGYGTWTIDATSVRNAFTGTVSLPAGFPATTVRSTSRTFDTSAGGSAWLPPESPPGQLVGSSEGHPYVSINPAANSAASPSTTTFTFATPTPVGVWGAALGDIDAESVEITATDATGAPVSSADLGVTSFNYCAAPRFASSCRDSAIRTVLPTLSATATSISAADPLCPTDSDHCSTSGASVWITPRVALSTLSVTSVFVSGLPAAQLWFASVARTVAGVITLGAVPPVVVQLVDADGDVVTQTTTDSDGSFTLPPVVPASDYVLRVDPASLPSGVVFADVPVDVSTGDATGLALAVADAVPAAAPGAAPDPALAATGQNLVPAVVVAAALMALGAVLARRRRIAG